MRETAREERAEENAWNSSQGKVARSNEDTKLEDQVDETDGRWEPQKSKPNSREQKSGPTAGKEEQPQRERADLQLVQEQCQRQARRA